MQIQYFEDNYFKEREPHQSQYITQNESNIFQQILRTRRKQQNHKNISKRKNKSEALKLKQILMKAKANLFKNNFINKLKRGISISEIPQNIINPYQTNQIYQNSFFVKLEKIMASTQGINLNSVYQCIWSSINLVLSFVIFVIFSIILAFSETRIISYFINFQIVTVAIYLIDVILNFITQRHQMGKSKKSVKQISSFYIENQFFIDFVSILIFTINFWLENTAFQCLSLLVTILKINNKIKDFQKFQYLYLASTQKQQYYGLFKVIFMNFAIGHILSTILNILASQNYQSNWYYKVQIQNEAWFIKYIWGYYWGTNIMLTVGFGDLCASNTTEALSLIFIETISCITLAYNINYVGSLISQMKASNQQRKKKLKYFHRMCQQNKISEQIQAKISNFISESYLIKEQFQFDQYQQVLGTIPKSLQSEYLKQSNKRLFDVPFFNSLNKQTLVKLAQNVLRKITHPEQIIQRKGQIAKFNILQAGNISYTCKNGSSKINGTVVQSFEVKNNQKPKILSLDFIKRNILSFDIKSIAYSVIYYLENQDFIRIIRECQMDFDLFCMMRDRDSWLLNQNQIYKCLVCHNQFHNKFSCPKYHYRPLSQNVIYHYLKKEKNFKQKKQQFQRGYRTQRTLHIKKQIQINRLQYILQYYDENQLKQIYANKKYYLERQNYDRSNRLTILFNTQNSDKEQALHKLQLNKIEQLFLKHNQNAHQQSFWNVETDEAYNYKYYFPTYNSNRFINFRAFQNKKQKTSKAISYEDAMLILGKTKK